MEFPEWSRFKWLVEKNTNHRSTKIPVILTYPNPFDNKLVVENRSEKMIQCSIFDMIGNLVDMFTLDHNSKKELNMSGLSAGVYVLKTNTGSTIKLIKTD